MAWAADIYQDFFRKSVIIIFVSSYLETRDLTFLGVFSQVTNCSVRGDGLGLCQGGFGLDMKGFFTEGFVGPWSGLPGEIDRKSVV